jgi:hypothetical protein
MWGLIKFIFALWILFILITGIVAFANEYDDCNDRGGSYTVLNGFECEGAKK